MTRVNRPFGVGHLLAVAIVIEALALLVLDVPLQWPLMLVCVLFVMGVWDSRSRFRLFLRVKAWLLSMDADGEIFVTDRLGKVISRSRNARSRAGDLSSALASRLDGTSVHVYKALYALTQQHDYLVPPTRQNAGLIVGGYGPLLVWRVLEPLDEDVFPTELPVAAVFAGRSGQRGQENDAFRQLPEQVRFAAHRVLDNDIVSDRGLQHIDGYVLQRSKIFAQGDIVLAMGPQGERSQREQFEKVLNDFPSAVLLATDAGEVVFLNNFARGLIHPGFKTGENLEALFGDVSVPFSSLLSGKFQCGPGDPPMTATLRDAWSARFVQIRSHPVQLGSRVLHLLALSDATELKSLEAQFTQSQKMQAIGQLAGGISHDFNNLLTAISGHCDLLLLRHDESSLDYQDLVQIQQNSNRAAALVAQLLSFSRKKALQPVALRPMEVLSELIHLLNRLLGANVNLSVDVPAELSAVRIDLRQFEQVIINLVVNARDAMPDGGQVRIKGEALDLERDTTLAGVKMMAGEYVRLRVSDTGCGIAAENLGKIYDPFFTTKRIGEGTGLGLSTVYGIVRKMGGQILVESTLGEGTKFDLILPAFNEPEEVVSTPAPSKPVDLTGRDVVLLVEDEDPVRSFAARALRLRGYRVIEAASGEEALDITADLKRQIDVIVSDVIMPGLDGPSWVTQALDMRPDVRVLFMSGYAEDVFEDGRPPIAHAGFLGKPFSLDALTRKIKELHPPDG